MALYFKLLLANLPLERVEHVWRPSKKKHMLPENATPFGFHRHYAPYFRENLGKKPTLRKWQDCVKLFLTRWCPHGKANDFKWKDSCSGGPWTLTSADIDRIAYHTTFQYATSLMHYDAYTKHLVPNADAATTGTTAVDLTDSD